MTAFIDAPHWEPCKLRCKSHVENMILSNQSLAWLVTHGSHFWHRCGAQEAKLGFGICYVRWQVRRGISSVDPYPDMLRFQFWLKLFRTFFLIHTSTNPKKWRDMYTRRLTNMKVLLLSVVFKFCEMLSQESVRRYQQLMAWKVRKHAKIATQRFR